MVKPRRQGCWRLRGASPSQCAEDEGVRALGHVCTDGFRFYRALLLSLRVVLDTGSVLTLLANSRKEFVLSVKSDSGLDVVLRQDSWDYGHKGAHFAL